MQVSFENLAPQVSRQICKELQHLISDPPEGIKVILNEEDISDIQAIIDGPGKSISPNQSFLRLWLMTCILLSSWYPLRLWTFQSETSTRKRLPVWPTQRFLFNQDLSPKCLTTG